MGASISKHKFKSSVKKKPQCSSSQCQELSKPRVLEESTTSSSSSKPCVPHKVDPSKRPSHPPKPSGPSHTPTSTTVNNNNNNNNSSSSGSQARVRAQRTESYEHLQLGSLTETWRNGRQWEKFKCYLRTLNEGTDSNGTLLSLERYAIFIELYSHLDSAERHKKLGREALKELIREIRYHPEDFFGRERCLQCIDAGMRSTILKDAKSVLSNELQPGLWVFQPAYHRVLDKLNFLVGAFHDPESFRS